MSGYVNLSEVGGLTRAGQGYGEDAESSQNESRNFVSRMDQSQQGLRGRTGTQFTNMVGQHGANLALLGRQFAEQAYRAVKGEEAIVATDDEGYDVQQSTAATVHDQTSLINRPINV